MTLNKIEKALEHLDIGVDVTSLWNRIHNIQVDETTIPIILSMLMQAYRIIDIPNWKKKQVVIIILSVLIDDNIEDQNIANFSKALLPHMVETLYDAGKANNLFRIKKSFLVCCK